MASDLKQAFDGPTKIEMKEMTISEKLGSGVFGVVHKGICRGNEVAIKVPTRKKLSKKEFDLFLREIDLMKGIHHPHIVLLMGACYSESDNKIYIVTELLAGDVANLMTGSYKLSTRLDWCYQAACGLCWLHNMHPPVLHQDLKPSNLLHDSSMKVKVCDFGLSQVIPEGEEYIVSQPRGTPLYMAPEVLAGAPTGTPADVYSFAIMMWEILTGQGAFKEYNNLQKFKRDVHQGGKRPEIPGKWPAELKELITKMWAYEAEDRPSFGGESRHTIVNALKNLKEQVEAEEYIEELRKNIFDEEGVKFWQKNFATGLEVDWEDFIVKFYEWLGQPVPKDPTALGNDPTPSQLLNASMQQLRRLEKKGVASAKKEIDRRNAQAHAPSVKKDDAQMYFPEQLLDPLDEAQCALLCLKGLLYISSKNEEGVVDTNKFGLLLLYFGSPSSPDFLKNLTDLLRQDYFHGYLDGNQSATLLCNKPRGTFLVRFSAGRRQVAISLVDMKGVVKHLVIQQVPGKGFRLNKNAENYWPTVKSFIDDHTAKYNLQMHCPGSPFAHLFKQPDTVVVGYHEGSDDEDGETEEELRAHLAQMRGK
mmetsp:Transcript_390/g.567  ORF Transcript_390/g.567 Transcript_390/m.567 type:complete len:590 (-) Transcript_390:57-1826(-)|eukprot:CAMPEP_0201489754 /NCGR_PEP_ID=MMETSP0151_2-20130828/23572_1 /ASSEMBLY_ACC=CAM_ASM_000257 /TAXON_ID=200890 /ORGANISM="Paramoeba atlantica, Strain 621/1 / CCAP 1560/9" /LENGTH=589 /DNA_ID=CAMNT_0047875443 /DNA_START=46 /DNA_END=1815 /DNA_ORIENTATION=-